MPQGHLNIMEPGENLRNHQKSLPILAGQTAIKRGSVIVEDTGAWRLANAGENDDSGDANTPGAVCFWSLQDQGQPDVLMAGKLTGVPCTFPMLLEIDQIKSDDAFLAGAFVQCGDDGGDPVVEGLVVDHVDDHTAIGVVSKTLAAVGQDPVGYKRWSNDRLADSSLGGAERTGAPIYCIQIRTLYIPNLSTGA